MIKRNIFNKLLEWSKKTARKPLVLRGARQVGKTTVVGELAQSYGQFLPLNLEKKADRELFEQDFGINELINAIHFHHNKPMQAGVPTLLFIDEIQYSPQACQMLRYFYEERNDIHVISAGSLLETLIDRDISFPVGRVEYAWMYPLTFEEYLLANGEEQALAAWHTLPCPAYAHNKLLKCFHEFTLVGGMPEAVKAYAEQHDILAVNHVYESLMTAYLDDVEKYATSRANANVLRHVIASAPQHTGSRIKFAGFGQSNYGSRDISEAMRVLEKAMLIKLCYPTSEVAPPAIVNLKRSPKLQFLDTGLVNFTAGLQNYFFTLNDLNAIYRGQISENIVGQELLANQLTFGNDLKFWVRQKSQSNAEVDYIIPYQQYLIPIEIKSGKTGSLKSLGIFMDRAEHAYAIRLYAGALQRDQLTTPQGKSFTLLSLPYYLTGKLNNYLEALVNS